MRVRPCSPQGCGYTDARRRLLRGCAAGVVWVALLTLVWVGRVT
ncbi:twin-arginine translocation signal domain-containing protein, partial [Planosporangium mesophilum]